jgi:hypothetical protein
VSRADFRAAACVFALFLFTLGLIAVAMAAMATDLGVADMRMKVAGGLLGAGAGIVSFTWVDLFMERRSR